MVKAVVGANWGDEGKGKITDMLAEKADIIVRFQGGANAGHTIVNDYGKFALHTLPSGVFYSHTTSVIGNGVALNIPILTDEIRSITERNVPMPKILVSDRCQMVMPYHILFDQYEEERLGGKSFGSTKSGIAPFYSDKYAKIGFQVSELFECTAKIYTLQFTVMSAAAGMRNLRARRFFKRAMKSQRPTRQMMMENTAHHMMRWQMTSQELISSSSFQYSGKAPQRI